MMKNVREPCLDKCKIHEHTRTNTELLESSSASRFPMLLKGGQGGPAITPSVLKSKLSMGTAKTSPDRGPMCSVGLLPDSCSKVGRSAALMS